MSSLPHPLATKTSKEWFALHPVIFKKAYVAILGYEVKIGGMTRAQWTEERITLDTYESRTGQETIANPEVHTTWDFRDPFDRTVVRRNPYAANEMKH